jgi:hypothetical protein
MISEGTPLFFPSNLPSFLSPFRSSSLCALFRIDDVRVDDVRIDDVRGMTSEG